MIFQTHSNLIIRNPD
ncbi:hypothetical protein [Blautia faecis]